MAAGNIARFYEWSKKIVGVGMNYKTMLQKMGATPPPEPRLFLKPSTSYITSGETILVPEFSKEGLWYEVELGVIVGKKATRIKPDSVMDHIGGYCPALDMTCLSSITAARSQGLSWDIAKGFDTATVVGNFIPKDAISDPHNLNLWLKLNNEKVSEGNTGDLLFRLPELISFMSHCFTLEEGDLILSGSPGNGQCFAGDSIEANVQNVGTVTATLQNVNR